ncbi:MAG TPA: glycoside hydrolase family 78 protein [Armatimonadota bacterium]|jgi:alpha-L-rhamnosidase
MKTPYAAILVALALMGGRSSAAMTAQQLRCEYHANPVGMDVLQPRLSWIVESSRRAELQTAYQIIVSSRPDAEKGDLWDTGKVSSSETAHIAYAGKPLGSREEAYWKVRVWDRDGAPSAWSPVARWSMGLLKPSDWTAKWISAPPIPAEPAGTVNPFEGLSWIWTPGEDALSNAPKGARFFRKTLSLPAADALAEATFTITADDQFSLFINGQNAGSSDGSVDAWRRVENLDVGRFLKPGDNTLAIWVGNAAPGPAGVIGVLKARLASGAAVICPVDATWKSSKEQQKGWETAGFDDAQWPAAVETAKIGEAPWHVPGQAVNTELPPAPFMRREFRIPGRVEKATLSITALGLYEAHINGHRVGDDIFAPGWTDYHKRVYYRTYDVTDLVHAGENALGAILADGWACGYVGLGGRDRYGIGRPRLLAQLDVVTSDGRVHSIASDGSWKTTYGPIREADLLMGETHDGRLELPGWDAAAFNDAAWKPVDVRDPWNAPLQAYPGVPVREMRTLKPIGVTEPKPGHYVYDLGQNMVGWARVALSGERGAKVTLRFAEMLNPDGTVYLTNLRSARATDTVYLKGGAEVFEPKFTFHGFRYIEVTGVAAKPAIEDITGVVTHSDTPPAGAFSTSNAMVNQLQSNIEWGQRGNFLEVPTDCPQRDERLGWMGDAQVFIRTACANMDTAAFFTKWLVDVDDAMRDGAFTDVSPDVAGGAGTAAWADAGIICPWTIYEVYGDKRVLERHYAAMARYVRWMERNSKDLLRPAEGYGEWLSIGADTPKDVLATAYFAYSTGIVAKAARVLGKTEDAAAYEDLYERVKAAFNKAYVSDDARIEGDTQACYVMALYMDLLPADKRAAAARRLVNDIRARGNHLSTGFIGTGMLNPVLSREGYTDVAYQVFLQDTFPSWFFSIKQGATTIWERWDGWTPEKGFQDPGMNSFNHYSFGAVGQWMQATVGGIDTDTSPEGVGFRRIVIAPEPGGDLTHAETSYAGIRGVVKSAWKQENGVFSLKVTIPANTTATVSIPAASPEAVTEGSRPAAQSEGVRFLHTDRGRAVYFVGSGEYEFQSSR